jgi:hypothetical protein
MGCCGRCAANDLQVRQAARINKKRRPYVGVFYWGNCIGSRAYVFVKAIALKVWEVLILPVFLG